MQDLSTLDFETLKVIEKHVKQQLTAKRPQVQPGHHVANVRVVLDVTGVVCVGNDFDKNVPLKINPFNMLLAAMNRLNGVTLESLVAEAKAMDGGDVSALKERVDAAWKEVADTTKTRHKGQVRVRKGSIVMVDNPPVEEDDEDSE